MVSIRRDCIILREESALIIIGEKINGTIPSIRQRSANAMRPWEVVGLTCDQEGIPADPRKKVELAKGISACRYPKKAMSSMEGYGLFVTQVCRDAGVPYHYGDRTITYSACILY